MGGGNRLDWERTSRSLKAPGMVNKILSAICGQEGLGKNGVKAELQSKITIRRFGWGEVALASLLTSGVFAFSHICSESTAKTQMLVGLKQYAEAGNSTAFENLARMIENPSTLSSNTPGPQYGSKNNSSSPAAPPPAPYLGPSASNYNMAPGINGFRVAGHHSKLHLSASQSMF